MYTFLLTLTPSDATLSLLKEGNSVATREWQESRDMGRQLFEAIQGLLTENRLQPSDIDDFQLHTDVPDTFTSVKIAQTVQLVFLFAVKNAQPKA